MLASSTLNELDTPDRLALAAALGDTVCNTMEVHALSRGRGRGFVLGDPGRYRAAVVEADSLPAEPRGYAADPQDLVRLLDQVEGWDCVLLADAIVDDVDRLVRLGICPTTKQYRAVHLALAIPARVPRSSTAGARILGLPDLPVVMASRRDLQPDGFASATEALSAGMVAGAVQDGRLVSIAYVEALTERHGAITIHTEEAFRGRGLATAGASLVATDLQKRGLTPVWYTGWDNDGSLRIAAKLGFEVVDRPVYLIRES